MLRTEARFVPDSEKRLSVASVAWSALPKAGRGRGGDWEWACSTPAALVTAPRYLFPKSSHILKRLIRIVQSQRAVWLPKIHETGVRVKNDPT